MRLKVPRLDFLCIVNCKRQASLKHGKENEITLEFLIIDSFDVEELALCIVCLIYIN